MKKKQWIATLLALSLCISLLSACGGGGGEGSNDNNNDSNSNNSKVYTFTVVNHDSLSSMGEQWVETLLNAIAEESNGRIKFNYQPGGSLYGATETLDAVKDGGADICWYTTGSYGGIFPISEFINLTGNGINSAQMGSAVLNTMYNEMPEVAAEYTNWHVLVIHGTSNSPFSTVGKKVETVDDLRGLSIRAAGTIPTLYLNTLGCRAISMPTSEVYESLSKKTLDGMCNDWHNIDCFNLYEPIDYCMDVLLNETASGLLMNNDRWNELPDDLKEIFNKYCNSYFAADMAGYWWDSCRYWVADEMEENGVEIYEPSDEVYNYMFSDEVLNSVHKGYIDYLNGYGLDGQAIYDQCMDIVARYAGDYAGVWDSEFNYTDWDMSAVDGYQAIY